jgi:hypothetical protein
MRLFEDDPVFDLFTPSGYMSTALEVETTENAGRNLRSVRELMEGLHAKRQLAPKDHQHHLRATQIGVAASVQCLVQRTSAPAKTAVSHKNF